MKIRDVLTEQGVSEGHADQQRKIVKQNGRPVGEIGIDRESSPGVGQYYMKHYASGTDNSGYDSAEEALGDLRHVMKQSVYGELREHDGRDDEEEDVDDDGRTMSDRARRDGRGGDDLEEPETAAQRRKRSLQATRDFNRGRRADSMREGVAEAVDPGRRRILAGILGLAAQGVVPQSVASALTQGLAAPADSGDVLPRAALKLLAAIRSRLEQFAGDQRFDREMANIAGKLGMSVDQFDEFMDSYEYGSDPEQVAQQLVQHLQSVDPRSISVTDRDFDDDDDDDQASGTDLAQAINTATSAAGRGQAAAVAGAAVDQFRSLVQRVMSAGQTQPSPVRDMGRIEPTSSAPALPAPDLAATDIMAQLRDVVGRDLTDQEREVVRQEVNRES